MNTEKKYLIFEELEPKPKTKQFAVKNKSGCDLGFVKWYAPWRRYCYFTEDCGNVFDAGCLAELKEFIDKLMLERKGAKNG